MAKATTTTGGNLPSTTTETITGADVGDLSAVLAQAPGAPVATSPVPLSSNVAAVPVPANDPVLAGSAFVPDAPVPDAALEIIPQGKTAEKVEAVVALTGESTRAILTDSQSRDGGSYVYDTATGTRTLVERMEPSDHGHAPAVVTDGVLSDTREFAPGANPQPGEVAPQGLGPAVSTTE